MLSTVVRIRQTDRVSAWGAFSATVTCYSLPAQFCLRIIENKLNYRTTSMRCSVPHIYNAEMFLITSTTTTNVVDDTVLMTPPAHCRGRGPSWWIDTNFRRQGVWVGDFNRSKNAILTTPPAFGAPVGVISSNFVEFVCVMQLQSLLFSCCYV